MKKLLLLALAPIAIGSICVSAFAQIEVPKKINSETSDKWVVIPVPAMKGVLGRLEIGRASCRERV